MSKFELFCLIYYALEKYSNENPLDDRKDYLSGMCPFTFEDLGSADPEIFEDFIQTFGASPVDIGESYLVAKNYVSLLNIGYITEAFAWVTEEKWIASAKKYLASNHKGK